MNTNTTAAEPKGVPNLELAQDERGYAGVELRQNDQRLRRPLRLVLFANSYGTFEASFDLTLGEAEELHGWLDAFIADEKARYKDRATKLVGL